MDPGANRSVTGAPAPAPARDARIALGLSNITRRFGPVCALDDASMIVHPGTVHALLGENGAGKSTLMRIAFGMLRPDAGTITVDDEPIAFASPAAAIAAGLGMVHQHFTLVPAMTVAENLALGGRGQYSPREAARAVEELSDATGFALDPHAMVEALPVSAQQRVEIAKALARRARLLVLDEPTGVLAPAEVDDLLRWLRAYVARGNAAVLITHKLREALAVADDVTVLRRGVRVLSAPAPGTTAHSLTAAMLGEQLGEQPLHPRVTPVTSPTIFRAEHVTVRDAGGATRISGATFHISAGEMVGVVGVEGSGQHELLRALAGRMSVSDGILDRPATVGFVPEDRHGDAVLLHRTLAENVALRGLGSARGLIRWAGVRDRTRALMESFEVRAEGADAPMRSLSGGNQQKLVLARELHVEGGTAKRGAPPKRLNTGVASFGHHRPAARSIDSAADVTPHALVVENPTRGLDVRATAAIHARLREAASRGAAVVVYASDLEEVLLLAVRVLVVFNGTVRELPVDRDAIGRAMLGLAE